MKRNYWMKQSRQENLVYAAVWGLLFAAPLLSLYVRAASDAHLMFSWAEVFFVWRHFAVYLLLFLIHNFLLAPLLVSGRRRGLYFGAVAALVVMFTVYQCTTGPDDRGHKPHMERPRHHQPPQPLEPQMADHQPRHDRHRTDGPPPLMAERDILGAVLLLLMFGANLGIKNYLRSRDDRKRLAELQRENLEQQLEYLRYQINPHFFMNTLNNIHALVDIDPEKAKGTILELSRMMRYVLYEGNKLRVPLSREFDFIRHYVALMQLRYTDKVQISLRLPAEVPEQQIPPLVLITFVENAFKHGVSYQRPSFISVGAEVEAGRLRFTCRNSMAEKTGAERGGVGLQNVRKRLDLLYDDNYSLQITDDADVYTVQLSLPL